MTDVRYVEQMTFDPLDGTGTMVIDASAAAINPTGLVRVTNSIWPVNVSASSPNWVNDTIEVFRACPMYGSGDGDDVVTFVGRNFLNTGLNYCRFRACYYSNGVS